MISPMARRLAICLLLTIVGGAGARPSGEPAGATLHLVALDGRGQSIRNLQAADVEIVEKGESRKISSLTFRGAASRQIALFLDDYHVTAGENTERARAAARAFADVHVRPTDTLFVMRPLDSQQAITPVPSLDSARERITSFDGRKGQYEPRGSFEAQYLSSAPAAVARERRQIVRSAVQALATAMRGQGDTAKALVVVTEGFTSDERGRVRGTTTLRTLARVARLADIPVYVIDPSAGSQQPTPFNETWQRVAAETGGAIMEGTNDAHAYFGRVAVDLDAQYLIRFEPSGTQDGAFHGLDVRIRRPGGSVRAPAGYWAPFPPSSYAPMSPRVNYARLLTPQFSGLIQPWFRMAPGPNGATRVTFLWTHRPSGVRAHIVQFQALTFEGNVVHDSMLHSRRTAPSDGVVRTEFDAPPGPLQISMAISTDRASLLATDVRYIEVPKLDPTKPVITGIEFIRPRSLPEFNTLRHDPGATPTEVRDFVRQDRLLVRVRAYAGENRPEVHVRLLNRRGELLLELPFLSIVDDATQFELPFARFPKGDYRLEVRAAGAGTWISQVLPIRLSG
jgi:VWFA-related protein